MPEPCEECAKTRAREIKLRDDLVVSHRSRFGRATKALEHVEGILETAYISNVGLTDNQVRDAWTFIKVTLKELK